MRKIILLFSVLLFANFGFSQKENIEIIFNPQLGIQPFELGRAYQFDDSEVSFEILKFYVSHLKILNKNETVWEETDSYHLIDLSESESLNWILELPIGADFDKIQFQIGIDSLTHEAGVMGGDLDPTKGMYWAWNTGYINFKLEGKSSLSSARDKSFQYHLGGYMPPFQTVEMVELSFSGKEKIELKMDVSKFLEAVDLAEQPTVMSPGEKAKILSKVVATIFYVSR